MTRLNDNICWNYSQEVFNKRNETKKSQFYTDARWPLLDNVICSINYEISIRVREWVISVEEEYTIFIIFRYVTSYIILVRKWLLFNAKWASNFVTYIMAEIYYILMRWWDVRSVLNQQMYLDFYTTSSLKQQFMGRNVPPFGHNILIPSQPVIALTPKCCLFSREAANTKIIVFGLTWPGLEPTIYHTQNEHANHYTTARINASDVQY